jgi:hypothetical protein
VALFLTGALSLVIKQDTVNPPTSLLFFKIVLATLVPLIF